MSSKTGRRSTAVERVYICSRLLLSGVSMFVFLHLHPIVRASRPPPFGTTPNYSNRSSRSISKAVTSMKICTAGRASRPIKCILIHRWLLPCPLMDQVKVSTLLHNVEVGYIALHFGNPVQAHDFEVGMAHYCLSEILETMILINRSGYL